MHLKDLTEILKGTLEGSTLEVIRQKTTYGYDITQQLRQLGFEDIVEGTVYTILLRLEKNGHISAVKKPSTSGPPRKYYSLTETGLRELAVFWTKWDFVSSKMKLLRSNI